MASAAPSAQSGSVFTAERPLQPVQWAAIIGGIAVLVWAIPGLIVNPDFAIGDDATSEKVLGVDMNGWHAVSGFLISIPAFIAALRASWAALVCVAAAAGLLGTALWVAFDPHVAGVFYLPDQAADALFHIGTALIFILGAVHYYLFGSRSRRALS